MYCFTFEGDSHGLVQGDGEELAAFCNKQIWTQKYVCLGRSLEAPLLAGGCWRFSTGNSNTASGGRLRSSTQDCFSCHKCMINMGAPGPHCWPATLSRGTWGRLSWCGALYLPPARLASEQGHRPPHQCPALCLSQQRCKRTSSLQEWVGLTLHSGPLRRI